MSDAKSGHWAWAFTTQRRSWLLTQARGVCRNGSDAEDLVQESILRFVQFFGKVPVAPNEKACEVWLVRTLTNLFYDQCRRRKVQEHGAKELGLDGEAEAPQPSARPAFDSITDEQFSQALQSLSPKIRETYQLHAAGMKYQDISQKLDVPMGTVAKRLHDAREKLRELLKRHATPGVH